MAPTIRYSVVARHAVPLRLAIYGLDGRVVAELWNGGASVNPLRLTGSNTADHRGSAEERAVIWNASGYPAGEYFVRLQSGRETAVRKIVLVKQGDI